MYMRVHYSAAMFAGFLDHLGPFSCACVAYHLVCGWVGKLDAIGINCYKFPITEYKADIPRKWVMM